MVTEYAGSPSLFDVVLILSGWQLNYFRHLVSRCDADELLPESIAGHFDIVGFLQPGPVMITESEISRQAQASIGGYSALTVENGGESGLGHTDCLSQSVGAESHGDKELLTQDLARVNWFVSFSGSQ